MEKRREIQESAFTGSQLKETFKSTLLKIESANGLEKSEL